MASKQKKFLYKRVMFLKAIGDPKVTFEFLLDKANKKLQAVSERFEKPEGSDIEKRFINYHLKQTSRIGDGTIYGCEFLAFDEGEEQSTINVKDLKAKELPVSAIKAGTDQEFLAGTIYFGASGDHVVVCQSRGLRTKDLEDYLNWLLVRKAKVLDSENRIWLSDHISDAKKAKFKGVRGIEISSPVEIKPVVNATPVVAVKKDGEWVPANGDWLESNTTKTFFPIAFAGKAWEAVKTLIGDSIQLPTEINSQNLTDTPSIELKISLKWKGRHHEDDSDFLDSVASNMRHIDDEMDYTIIADSGTATRNEIKTFTMVNVR